MPLWQEIMVRTLSASATYTSAHPDRITETAFGTSLGPLHDHLYHLFDGKSRAADPDRNIDS